MSDCKRRLVSVMFCNASEIGLTFITARLYQVWQGADNLIWALTNTEGDSGNDVAAEAVLQAFEDFVSTVANDFSVPNRTVDVDHEGAVAQGDGMCVRDDVRVHLAGPNFEDFGFGKALVDTKGFQHAFDRFPSALAGLFAVVFGGFPCPTAPFCDGAIAGGRAGRAKSF